MNKLLYRVIFNKTRGMLMVVADIARSGRASHPRRERSKTSAIRLVSIAPLRLALYLAAGLVSLPQHAAIRADRHAPGNQQPTIDVTANGLPQINIQTPNEHGVSRNQYSQFDVDSRGAILNNSHNATRTQLAGQITGNPWLAKQEARIILNEVNSRNLSKLNGFIEVAGRRAEVIIANPYGITCNGCGFINAEQAMLVAGQARMEGGKLKGFDVDGGRINITGKGLNTRDADYTRLIARAVHVNARVQTEGNLKVTTGRNKTDVNGRVTRAKKQDEGSRPDFALDVAVLGGMYANKIMLEGTEFGVGVRNAGELGAMAGELSLSVNGQLINSGHLSGQKDLQLAAKGDMHHTGSLTAGGNLKLSVPGTLHNEGMIRGGKDVHLTAAVIENARQGTLSAGSDNQGITGKQGDLLLTASGELKMQGQHLAAGNLKATGSRIDLGDSQTQGRTVTLNARQGDVRTANAVVRGSDSVKVRTHTLLDNSGGEIVGGTLNLQTPELNNTGGLLHQERAQNLVLKSDVIRNNQGKLINAGNTHLQVARIENQAGVLAANGYNLTLDTHSLDNRQGTVQLAGHGELQLFADQLESHNGKILSSGKLSLSGRSVDLSAAETQAQQIILTANSLNNNNGTLLAPGSEGITLNVAEQLSNRNGRIESGGNLRACADRLDNTKGSLLATRTGDIMLTTTAETLNTQGKLLAGRHLNLDTDRLDNQEGLISATDGSTLLNSRQAINNSGGQMAAKNTLALNTGTLNNTRGQIISKTDNMALTTLATNNNQGRIQAGNNLILNTQNQILDNRDNKVHGGITAGGNLTIQSGILDNQQGTIQGGAALSIETPDAVDNRNGHLMSQDSFMLAAAKLDNRYGVTKTGNGQLMLQHKLDNTAGLIQSDGTLLLDTRQVINRNTSLPDKGLQARVLTITAHKLDNTLGALRATDSLIAKVHQKLENKRGLVASQGRLQVEGNTLDVYNYQGKLIAAMDARLTASSLGGDGKIQSQGALNIRLKQDFHNTDIVNASGDLTLVTDGKVVNNGTLTGQQRLDLGASDIINTADGYISAQETHLTASKTLNNTGLIDGGLTHPQATTLSNTGTGRIFGDHVAIAAGVLNNLKHRSKAAVIAARDRLDIGVGTVNNSDHALITSQGDIAFGATLDTLFQAIGQGKVLNNHGALVGAGHNLIIDMKKVSNTNRNLSTQRVQVEKSAHHEAVLRGHNRRYNLKQVDTRYQNKYGVHDAVMPDGRRSNEFYEYHYLRTVNETQVKSSEPGKILAKKNLTFNTEHLANYDSQIIAGGTLGGNVGTLDNHATKGERITTDRGWQTYWYSRKQKKKYGGTKISQGREGSHYRPAPAIQTLDLKTLAWQGNTVPQGNSIDIGMRQTPGFIQEPSELFKGYSQQLPAGQTYTLTLPPEVINGQTIIPFICTVSPNIQLPDNSLFSLHPGTDSQYWVETDPRFVDKKQWLTSDYMQKALTTDHNNTHKRLGDGYYEQQLIRDQLIQLTGQRYTRNHAQDEARYQALMSSGIPFRKHYQLQPGVELTPAQMALLTTDIVWLADRNVRLADGSIQKVRIPQVYAKLKENDLSGDGALLSGKEVTLTARETIRNKGAQGRGEKIVTDVGRNLTLQSQQESNHYDARQQNFSAGGSFTFGSMTGSGYLSVTQDKLNSNFESVKDQSGLFAGKGGYDVKVHDHTRLEGAVLDSRAEADKNRLDTGTFSWTDIHNQADFSVEHTGVSLSSGGSVGKDLLTNMAGGLLLGGNNSDHAEGTTKAGVSEGSLIIRNTQKQQQDITRLNRDTAHANEGRVSPIFNREKEQKRLRQAHLVSEIGLQVLDIYHTQKATKATRAATELLSDSKKWQALQNHALVGSLQALAGGDTKAAPAQGAAPYLAAQVKNITTDGKSHDTLSQQEKMNNIVAHTLLGGVIARLSYGYALAGATGALTGELATPVIALVLYGTTDSDKLTSRQKENLILLVTLASGIVAGISSDSPVGAVVGAQAGRNAVENNFLSSKQVDAWSAEMKTCQAGGGDCSGIIKEYEELSTVQQKQLISDCASDPASCQQKYGGVLTDSLAVKQTIDRALGEDIPIKMVYDLTATFAHQLEAEGVVATNKVSEALQKEYGLDEVQAAVVASAAVSAFGGISKYQPNKGAVGNMNELLKQPGFGNQIKNKAQKSSQQYQGQTVYKATNDLGPNIKKGEQFYLDGQHKNHLEVFDKRGSFRAVLNLDGTVNKSKSEAAKGGRL